MDYIYTHIDRNECIIFKGIPKCGMGMGREFCGSRSKFGDRGVCVGGDVRASEISVCDRTGEISAFMVSQSSSLYRHTLERHSLPW